MAEFKGEQVTLNKVQRIRSGQTSYGKKKYQVFVQDGGRVRRITFGDPNLPIRRGNAEARANFRARHNCDNPGPRTKARYWACKVWNPGTNIG